MIHKPLIIAHRGASGIAPENTMTAFQKAAAMGVQMIELDVHLTKDDQLAVIHDPTLNRTTNGSGRVLDYTWPELQKLDAGSWFGPEFAEERIPSLEEVIAKVKDIQINIEVKIPAEGNREEVCQRTVSGLINTLNQAGLERFWVSSFDFSLLNSLRKLNSDLKLAYLFYRLPLRWRKEMRAWSQVINAVHPHRLITGKRLLEEAANLELTVRVWTVDTPPSIRRFTRMGVDGIFSNYPERCLAEIRGL